MTLWKTMLAGSVLALATALCATPAAAQATCDLNGTDGGSNANPADGGATATGTSSTACGEGATADQAGGVALGDGATASGPSNGNVIFASIAIGYDAFAYDNAIAIGNSAIARFSGTVNPVNLGINSATAVGGNAVAIGANTVAIGSTARAGTGFTIGDPSSPVTTGTEITAIGGRAEANQDFATTVGARSQVSGIGGTATGAGAIVTQAGGVAIGRGAVAGGPSSSNDIFASTAVGLNAQAIDNGVAIGHNAAANFSQAVTPANLGVNSASAFGSAAVAVGANTVAIGSTARAGNGFTIGDPASQVTAGFRITVIGGRAESNADESTVVGANSRNESAGAVLLGANNTVGLGATNAIVIGTGLTGTNANTVLIGSGGSTASADGAVAIGNGVTASGANAAAVGTGAAAAFDNSTAIGAGATTTRADQVMLGGTGSSVTVGDIAASTAAQTGPIFMATTDSSGTLGMGIDVSTLATDASVAAETTARIAGDAALGVLISDESTTRAAADLALGSQIATESSARMAADLALDNRIDALELLALDFDVDLKRVDRRASAGTATAIALSGNAFLPDKKFNLTGNMGFYRGAYAGSLQVGAMVSDRAALNAGVAKGFNRGGKVGARVGFTLGW